MDTCNYIAILVMVFVSQTHNIKFVNVYSAQAPGGIATPQVYSQLLALYLLHNDM